MPKCNLSWFSGASLAFGVAALLVPSQSQGAEPPPPVAAEDPENINPQIPAGEDTELGVSTERRYQQQKHEKRRDGAFRLHIETDLVGYTHFNPDGSGNGRETNSVGFGIGRLRSIDAARQIPSRPVIGLGFGYLFPGQRALVGTRLAFDIDVDDIGEDRQSVDFGGEFIPYFQYIFLPDRRVRPYLEGRFGIIGGTRIRDVDVLELEDVRESRTTVAPTVGGGAGLHIWLIDEFSIDVALNADYWAPFTQVGFDEDVGDIDSDFNRTGDAVNVSLMTGLSVWF